ncbi:MAG: hypothetical protein NZ872_02695 [Archaeoglobaceae archaeon]|nr:hypothetical protein [Archaeoglobaceae archaeon]MDW8128106.1 hypothetical protein [Archaeoglobaceae archaeon]
MRHKFYVLESDEKITKDGIEDLELFKRLKEAEVKKAILLGKENAIYFETFEKKFVMVGIERNLAGSARLIARKLVFESGKKIDLSSIEEAFEFAKKVESADLDELAKLR